MSRLELRRCSTQFKKKMKLDKFYSRRLSTQNYAKYKKKASNKENLDHLNSISAINEKEKNVLKDSTNQLQFRSCESFSKLQKFDFLSKTLKSRNSPKEVNLWTTKNGSTTSSYTKNFATLRKIKKLNKSKSNTSNLVLSVQRLKHKRREILDKTVQKPLKYLNLVTENEKKAKATKKKFKSFSLKNPLFSIIYK